MILNFACGSIAGSAIRLGDVSRRAGRQPTHHCSGWWAETGTVDLVTLTNMLSCIVDGAIMMSKVLKDPGELERQVLAYRDIVQLVSLPPPKPLRTSRPATRAQPLDFSNFGTLKKSRVIVVPRNHEVYQASAKNPGVSTGVRVSMRVWLD